MTKKVTADKEEPGLHLPNIVVENLPEVERGRFYFISADIGDTLAVVWDMCRLHRMKKRQNHVRMNSETKSERLLREL